MEGVAQAFFEGGAEGFESRVELGDEALEGGEASGDGDGVTAEGAGLIHGAEGRDAVHDVFASAIGREGHATADDFTERGHVGDEAITLLCAAGGEAAA